MTAGKRRSLIRIASMIPIVVTACSTSTDAAEVEYQLKSSALSQLKIKVQAAKSRLLVSCFGSLHPNSRSSQSTRSLIQEDLPKSDKTERLFQWQFPLSREWELQQDLKVQFNWKLNLQQKRATLWPLLAHK